MVRNGTDGNELGNETSKDRTKLIAFHETPALAELLKARASRVHRTVAAHMRSLVQDDLEAAGMFPAMNEEG